MTIIVIMKMRSGQPWPLPFDCPPKSSIFR